VKVSFCKQEKKRALGRAWVLLRVLEITRQKFPRKKSRDISNFLRYLKMFMYFIHVFSRNRKRCSAEPRLESTALDGSGRTTAGSSRGNCQYLYTAEIASTCTPRKLPVPVHRGNCQYLYTAETASTCTPRKKFSTLSLIYSSAFVQKK